MSKQVIKDYFAAWNSQDAIAVQSLFAADGSYRDPNTGGPLYGEDIAGYVAQLCDVFPDLYREQLTVSETKSGVFAVPWVLSGTQYGDLGEIEASGRSVTLPGCDFFTFEDGGLVAVASVFDPDVLSEQLE